MTSPPPRVAARPVPITMTRPGARRPADRAALRAGCGDFVGILKPAGGACVMPVPSFPAFPQAGGLTVDTSRGAGERIRTADLPLTRSMLPGRVSPTCTNATRECCRCTKNQGIARRSVPRRRTQGHYPHSGYPLPVAPTAADGQRARAEAGHEFAIAFGAGRVHVVAVLAAAGVQRGIRARASPVLGVGATARMPGAAG
jgi:hypothetical protein